VSERHVSSRPLEGPRAGAQPDLEPTLDGLRRKVASVTGAARARVDVARHGSGHLARQLTYALAPRAARTPDLRALLRTLATESERLSGRSSLILGRLSEAERRVALGG